MTKAKACWATLLLLTWAGPAAAEPPPPPEPPAEPPVEDDALRRGREAFTRGLALADQEQWGEALEAFEEAAANRDAPLVQFNIAYCLRALGRYVAARQAIRRALANEEALPPPQRGDAHAWAVEFDQIIVRVDATLVPDSARLSVDGRPLLASSADDGALLAGVAPAGEGEAHGKKNLTLLLDPGAHVFRAVRKGHGDALVRKSYRAGQRATLDLHLDELPATVRLRSTPAGAIVRVGGREVGVTPVEFERRAGEYGLEVVLDDYENYTATLELEAGQRADLTAELTVYETPLYERWWFWTGAAAVVAGAAVATWAATRPEPEPPPFEAGNTGWIAVPEAFRF